MDARSSRATAERARGRDAARAGRVRRRSSRDRGANEGARDDDDARRRTRTTDATRDRGGRSRRDDDANERLTKVERRIRETQPTIPLLTRRLTLETKKSRRRKRRKPRTRFRKTTFTFACNSATDVRA